MCACILIALSSFAEVGDYSQSRNPCAIPHSTPVSSVLTGFSPDKLAFVSCLLSIDHFTVMCLVAWPFNESETGVDLV